jgi:predicted dehydrogenase
MQRRPDVVLWGAGMVAGVHAAACQSLDWRVAAVASRSVARAADLAATVRATPTTFDDLLARKQGDIAIVATPPAAHVDAAVALLDVGYHVVVEAPLACTLAEADRLIDCEERVGRPVLYSEHLAAAPTVDGLLLRVEGIGALTHLSARATQAPPSWRPDDGIDAQWGGGALFDLGVHPVGLTLRAAAESGAGRPVSLSSIIVDAGTRHEYGTIKLRFEAGLVATIGVRWQPGSTPDWDLQASSASAVLRAELYPTPSLEHNGTAVAIGAPIRADGPDTRRRLRLRTTAEALLDEHPHRPPRPGDLAAGPPGARRDLCRSLVGGTRCDRGATAVLRPQGPDAGAALRRGDRRLTSRAKFNRGRGRGPSRSRRRRRR